MESISLDVMDFEPAGPSSIKIMDDVPSSSSAGLGMDFLMNKNALGGGGGGSGKKNSYSLGDIDNFENEMKSLSGITTDAPAAANAANKGIGATVLSGISNLFGSNDNASQAAAPDLGQRTKDETRANDKSWDGFMKFSDIPEKEIKPQLTEREKNKKKKAMLNRLNEWKDKGVIDRNVHFSQDMSYEEIEDEYETALENKQKKEAKKLYSWWFLTAVNTLEYANAALNPFDINLDGWGETVSDDIDSYDEIFGRLYEKYKGGEMSPELSLVMRLGFSAAMTSFTNKALSTATPGFKDVIRQSPELMKAFTTATAGAMAQQSPGFAIAQNLVNPEPRGPPPPAPVNPATERKKAAAQRPDLAAASPMFREQGVDIRNNQERMDKMERSPVQRPEMTGPRNTNLDSILSGLKPKPMQRDSDSIVSVSSIKELDGALPKRKGSGKNILSLESLDL